MLCQRSQAGESTRRVGDRIGVCHDTVLGVLRRKWLERVPSGYDAAGNAVYERPAIRTVVKLTEADVAEIRQLYKAGWLQREIADLFGVTQPHISKVLSRTRWA